MTSLKITITTARDSRLARIQRGYGVIAPAYDRLRPLWTGGALGNAEQFLERKVIPQYCPSGATVLDPDHQFLISLEHHWHFARGLHTLLLLAKDVSV